MKATVAEEVTCCCKNQVVDLLRGNVTVGKCIDDRVGYKVVGTVGSKLVARLRNKIRSQILRQAVGGLVGQEVYPDWYQVLDCIQTQLKEAG
jgi:hypothetical protein